MEYTKNEMPTYAKQFFYKLGNYLDTKVYYYGSVQRKDYFPESSDIDVDIFTTNESSTISQLQNLLGVEKYQFKKIVYNLSKKKSIVHGKKVEYENKEKNFRAEISIYSEKNKEDILAEHNYKMKLPFYILYPLIIVKFLYYRLAIISKDTYKYYKNFILNYLNENKEPVFVVTDIVKKIDDKNE